MQLPGNINLITIIIIAFGILYSASIQIPASAIQTDQVSNSNNNSTVQNATSNNNNSSLQNVNNAQSQLSLSNIFKMTDGSVVQIVIGSQSGIPGINPLEANTTALGSGFIYDNNGHIITNTHVIEDSTIVEVVFNDGNRYLATVIGRDQISDIAVLKIDTSISQNIIPLKLRNSSTIEVGEKIITIGSPFGLSNSMTEGIVSQTGRLFSIPDSGISVPNAIQTDIQLSPGNSGGPLLDTNGNVLGMVVGGYFLSYAGGSFNANFAIPSNTISKIVPALIENGTYSHPWLGFTGATITSDVASMAGMKHDAKGVLVSSLVKGGPADRAGLKGTITDQYQEIHAGDVIVSIDNHPVNKIEDIITYIEDKKTIGDKLLVQVIRNGQPAQVIITIDERPSSVIY